MTKFYPVLLICALVFCCKNMIEAVAGDNSDPYPNCGSPSTPFRCLFVCGTDQRCDTLGYNLTEVSCGCPCQKCPDGKVYGAFVRDYKNSTALDEDQRKRCPDIQFPCNKKNCEDSNEFTDP